MIEYNTTCHSGGEHRSAGKNCLYSLGIWFITVILGEDMALRNV